MEATKIKNPLISIIVPVYNAELYITKCINSLITQTYKNIEILLINDGSTDKTLMLITKISKNNERIKILAQENSGPSKARNFGLTTASGKYIAFIDADDYVDEKYIEILVENIKKNKSDLVVTDYVEDKGEVRRNIELFSFLNKDNEAKVDIKIVEEITVKLGGLVWGKLFKKNIIDNLNLKFDENLKMSEDLLFVLEYVTRIERISKAKGNYYFYNIQNQSSITHNYDTELFNQQLQVTKKVKIIIEKYKNINFDIDEIINFRFKSAVMYAIYKESISSRSYKEKLKNIESFINNEEIKNNARKFTKQGPIDKLIVKSIIKKRPVSLYLLTQFRTIALRIYERLNKG